MTPGGNGGPEPRKPPKAERLRALLPDLVQLVRPRAGLLAGSFVLMAVGRVAGLVLPASTKYLVDDVLGKGRRELLLPLVAAVVAATAVQGVCTFALTQLLSKAAQRLISELRLKLQGHAVRLQAGYFDRQKTGALASRVMFDAEGLRNLVGTGLVEFAGGLLTAVLALGVMASLSPLMTSLTLLFLLLFAGSMVASVGRFRPIFRERSRIQGEVAGRLVETFAGIRVVKGYHGEEREDAVFRKGVDRLLDNVLRTLTAMSVIGLSASVLLGLVGAAVMAAGARQILSGELTLGGFFTYTVLLGFLVAPVFQVVGIGTQMTEALAGLERMRELLGERREDADPRRTVAIGPLRGEVAFEDVRFSYEAGKEVLLGVSFRAAPGSVTALVGPSGSGKSTVIGLVAAFHSPEEGRVLVDGTDLSTVRLESFRTQLGVVLQESFLFDGTVRENVLFSRPSASEEELARACRVARVDEFAEKLPQGYDTVVGERGVKLSGGQRQRVSIARALLSDPRILILDEATSSLDSESEAYIQEGLATLLAGRTTFVIAHRLSTIRRADRILVLDGGRVVEQGTHQELLSARGRYFEMYSRQHPFAEDLFLAPGEGPLEPEAEEAAEAAEPGEELGERRRGRGAAGPMALLGGEGGR